MTADERTVAVVLSGGGAYGAYEVGVLKALVQGESPATRFRPLVPEIVCGTSAGSYNAAFLVSAWAKHGAEVTRELERVWLERLARQPDGRNGFYRFRVNPFDLLNPRAYLANPLRPVRHWLADSFFLTRHVFEHSVRLITNRDESFIDKLSEFASLTPFISREPWEETLRETIDYDSITVSPIALRVAATNWITGELEIFANRDMTPQLGPHAILSSSALPGFFLPARFGAQTYVDGGVLLNTPLRPAIRAGADEIHVAFLDPDIRKIPPPDMDDSIEGFYRMQQIDWAAAYRRDIADARSINRGIEVLRRATTDGGVTQAEAEGFVAIADTLWRQAERSSRYRLLTVHCYSPAEDLGGALGMIDLAPERLRQMINRGFQDTVAHDCRQSGCVVLEGGVERATDEAKTSPGEAA